MSGRDTRILMKLVVDGSSDRVLGCHIVGDAAAEITQAVAIAVKLKAMASRRQWSARAPRYRPDDQAERALARAVAAHRRL